ncbi:MAG TPA: DUF5668 domain-containing protein [Terriglobia bacterium]|nr:DUF5668 domain-containing protein [Terriglobia bacterium]
METKAPLSDSRAELLAQRNRRAYSLAGPVLLITLGTIFLVQQFVPGWGIKKTWPLLLVAIGITKLFEALFSAKSGNARQAAKPVRPEEELR